MVKLKRSRKFRKFRKSTMQKYRRKSNRRQFRKYNKSNYLTKKRRKRRKILYGGGGFVRGDPVKVISSGEHATVMSYADSGENAGKYRIKFASFGETYKFANELEKRVGRADPNAGGGRGRGN